MKSTKKQPNNTLIFGSILFFGLVGLIVAFILSYEKLELLKEPDKILSCSINAALNCASVMKTWQATVFGFPNSWIGLAAFPVIMAVGAGGLMGVTFTRSFMHCFMVGLIVAEIFALWLFFQSVYVIDVLCPWCLVVTFSVTMLLAIGMHYYLRENFLGLKKETHKRLLAGLEKDYSQIATMLWIAVLIIVVISHFGSRLTATGL
jgi:uncharacterized membrane protein